MADVSITTNDTFSTRTADTNFTRPTNAGETIVINSGQVNIGTSTQAGPITVNIDQDLVCNRLRILGHSSNATNTTTVNIGMAETGTTNGTIGQGVVIKCLTDAQWTADTGSINTGGYTTVNIYNSILKSTGNGPAIGQYQPTQDQGNVRMNIYNSRFENYAASDFRDYGDGGEPMIAPSSRLQNVVFRGFTKVWFNGSPTSDSYGIDMVSYDPTGGTLMGLAIADATVDVTFNKCSSDRYGIQQATTRTQTLNLIDCQLTDSIVINQNVTNNRVFNFSKTVGSKVVTGAATYPLRILNSVGVVQTITQTPGSETTAAINWLTLTNPGTNNAGFATMSAANVLSATSDTNFTIVRRLPLKIQLNDYRYKRLERVIDANALSLTTSAAKDAILLTGVADLDKAATLTQAAATALTGITITKATGTPSPTNQHTITVTASANRTLDDIYCFWKNWWVQDAQWDVTDEITVSGTRMILGNYKIVMA